MIVLLDRIGDAFERGGRMIELARDLDFQLRMARDGVIIDRDPAVGGDKFSIFCQRQGINFQRTRFNAARGGKQFTD